MSDSVQTTIAVQADDPKESNTQARANSLVQVDRKQPNTQALAFLPAQVDRKQPNTQALAFLPNEVALDAKISQIAALNIELHASMAKSTQLAARMGRLLLELKSEISHGNWTLWFVETGSIRLNMRLRSAQNYMRFAEFLDGKTENERALILALPQITAMEQAGILKLRGPERTEAQIQKAVERKLAAKKAPEEAAANEAPLPQKAQPRTATLTGDIVQIDSVADIAEEMKRAIDERKACFVVYKNCFEDISLLWDGFRQAANAIKARSLKPVGIIIFSTN